MKLIHKLFILTLLSTFAFPKVSFAEPGRIDFVPAAAISKTPSYFETGLSLGTPSGINLVLGYWSNSEFPWLARVSGMNYGTARGTEGDLGWQFYRRENFKQYIGASIISAHVENTRHGETFYGSGIGPVYGFNLYGVSFQAGLVFGNFEEIYQSSGARNRKVLAR